MGSIRFVEPSDAGAILDIYRPFVADTVITLEYDAPTRAEFQERVEGIAGKYPYLVYVEDGAVRGYAYAARHSERAGYRHNATTSVYLKPECAGRGVGTLLYSRLLAALRTQGVCLAYAIVTMPNPASMRLHEKCGFRETAVFRRGGYKFGKWLDILWLENRLRDDAVPPERLLDPREAFAASEG